MGRLNSTIAVIFSGCILGCGFLSDSSYEDDVANDRRILEDIIQANPVLDSAVKAGHYFLPTDAEYGKITGRLDLSGVGLNDSNFHFPEGIRNFRRVNTLSIASNDLTDLPLGTKGKKWERVIVWFNRMCSPSQETVAFLDQLMDGYPGGYWRDLQRCDDSNPEVTQ